MDLLALISTNNYISNLASYVRKLDNFKNCPQTPRGGTPYIGLYGEAPPERGTFFRLQVYKRVGISRAEVHERVGKSVIKVSKRAFNFRVDNDIVFWLTSLLVILFSPDIVY